MLVKFPDDIGDVEVGSDLRHTHNTYSGHRVVRFRLNAEDARKLASQLLEFADSQDKDLFEELIEIW